MDQNKNHWETVYQTKQSNEVSWTQDIPNTSLDFIHGFGLPETAAIIDIGGGDSRLVDFLPEEGYKNIIFLLQQINKYIGIANNAVKGFMTIGTFGERP